MMHLLLSSVSESALIGDVGGGGGEGGPRYWRINVVTGGNGGGNTGYFSIAELEMRATTGGADLTGGETASASDERSGFEASLAIDNDSGTSWSPSNDPAFPLYLDVDYGSDGGVEITEVSLTARTGYSSQMVLDFDVQYSEDDVTWTTAWSVSGEAAYTDGETRVFTKPVPAAVESHRYWRFVVLEPGSASYCYVCVLEFKEDELGSDLTGSGTPTADYDSGDADHPFDGTNATVWQGAVGKYLQYDFGSDTEIGAVTIQAHPSAGERSVHSFAIEYSDDAVVWTRDWEEASGAQMSDGEIRTHSAPWKHEDQGFLIVESQKSYAVESVYSADHLHIRNQRVYVVEET